MKRLLLGSAALAVAASLTVGLSSGLAATRSAGRATVAVGSTSLGRILVNSRGRTLYLFEKDKRGKSGCVGKCAAFWPPLLTSGKPLAAAGAKASLLGTTKRSDGKTQVTYAGHPLYAYVGDSRAGQANGEGSKAFGAEWYVVNAKGKKVDKD